MGLDMYLSAEKSFYQTFIDRKQTDTPQLKKLREAVPEMYPCGNLNYVRVKFEVAYWRKANHIHGWFVRHVQSGNDDCGDYYVSRDQLQKLLDTVNNVLASTELIDGKVSNGYTYTDGKKVHNWIKGKVLSNRRKAQELLPVQEGFFFGNDEYDQWYYQDLEYTRDAITKALQLPQEWDYEYHASW